MDPTVVLFAIEAGVRLGRKLNAVLVDATSERALILPLGNLYADVAENDAKDYFRAHPELTAGGGPYANLTVPEKIKAYRTIKALNVRLNDADEISGDAREILVNLQKFKQVQEGFGAKPALQRVLGEVVAIAIDYFAARPEMLAGDTASRKIVSAFIAQLDDIEWAESTPRSMVSDLLLAAVQTLDGHIGLVDDDPRLQALLGGITKTFIHEWAALTTQGDQVRHAQLLKRIASSVLRGGATAFCQNADLFVGQASAKAKMVETALSQFLAGIAGQENLFTNACVELLFNSVLQAAAEHTELFCDQKIMQALIGGILNALISNPGKMVFAEQTVTAVLRQAVEVASLHVDTLIDAATPQQQLLADAVAILAITLAEDIGHGKAFKDLLGKRHLIQLTQLVFMQVAQHPELILSKNAADPRCAALAQIIRCVALAMTQAPEGLICGDGLAKIMETALQAACGNMGKLLNAGSHAIADNILFRAIHQIVTAILTDGDPRGLITAKIFPEIIGRTLPIVSANVEALSPDQAKPIERVVQKVLGLASGGLENRINQANLPLLIEQLLIPVLWDELDLQDDGALEAAARLILRKVIPSIRFT